MVVCTICEEEIPKAKRCTHGKKPTNCGGACLTAYVGEHEAMCQGRKATVEKGKTKDSGEEAGSAESAKHGKEDSKDTTDLETTDCQDAAPANVDLDNEMTAADPYAAEAEGIIKMVRQLRNTPVLTTCRNCNKTKQELGIRKIRKCTRCGLVGYCGKECQQQHWQTRHKKECKMLREIAVVDLSNEDVKERLNGLEGGDF